MDSLIKAISMALDAVEKELLGASTNHGKRIAVLCGKMGKLLGKTRDEITALATCALLHDNALTEYILTEKIGKEHDPTMMTHCAYGQRNVNALQLNADVRNFILYHHERADGNGPFGIREGEGPVEAELIAIADSIDVAHHFQQLEPGELSDIRKIIARESGGRYGGRATELMLEVLDRETLFSLKDEAIEETVAEHFAPWPMEIETKTVFGLAGFMAGIIDCKSVFTQVHSRQIANKAWFMAEYYDYNHSQKLELYLAAALHDIGKLVTPTAILEKPGKLSNEEFSIMKDHVRMTWEFLKDIEGLDRIAVWAAGHHEKLDGTGYPHGKKSDELDFNCRLMACIDIYQAVSEERPYHAKRNHAETMQILNRIAGEGKVDAGIAKDLDVALAGFDGGNVPTPQMA